jgi:hypothetical protein
MRRLLLVLVAAAALVGCASSAATLRSGAFGAVTRGPTSPVCSAEQPCTEAAVGATLRFLRGGQQVARVVVGPAGTYRIHLAPGLYAVRAGRRVDPATFRVRAGAMTRVDLSIDTGIR